MPRTPKWERDLDFAVWLLKQAKRKKRKKRRMGLMTQQQAAKELGVSHTAIKRYRRWGLVKEVLPGVSSSVLLKADSVYALKPKSARPKRGRPRKVRP